MNKACPQLALALVVSLLAGCSASSSDAGSARFAVSVPQALASDISRVSVTSSAADIPSVTVDLAPTHGVWGGIIGNIPAGSNRSFLAQAFDSSGTLLFEGSASGVTISANQTTLVAITLQQLNPPPPFDNEAPLIDSLVASSTSVHPGGSISLVATAHDPNPGDTLSFAWSATAGSFSSASAASTSWTAPASTGLQTLTLTVTDSRGLASSVSLAVNVTPGGGEGERGAVHLLQQLSPWSPLSVPLPRGWPSGSPPPSPSPLPTRMATASPTPGAPPARAPGANASSSSAQFTPSAAARRRLQQLPPDRHRLRRARRAEHRHRRPVRHQYASRQSLSTLSSSAPTAPRTRPRQARCSPSRWWPATPRAPLSPSPGQPMPARWAHLPTASHSRITWTAPSCAVVNTPTTLTATVTNAFNLTATRAFHRHGAADLLLGRGPRRAP